MSKRFTFYRTFGYTIEVPDNVPIDVDEDGQADAEALVAYMDAHDKWPDQLDAWTEDEIEAYALDTPGKAPV